MAEPKPTETPRPSLLDRMTEFEDRALSGGASPGVSDWEALRRTNDALRSLLLRPDCATPAPETPEPTLNDLLTACDLAEEAGAPVAVLEELRRIVGLGARVEGKLPLLIDAFNPGGIMQHWGRSIGDVIADGIPALVAELTRLRNERDPPAAPLTSP
jgi:hypothetical protein